MTSFSFSNVLMNGFWVVVFFLQNSWELKTTLRIKTLIWLNENTLTLLNLHICFLIFFIVFVLALIENMFIIDPKESNNTLIY